MNMMRTTCQFTMTALAVLFIGAGCGSLPRCDEPPAAAAQDQRELQRQAELREETLEARHVLEINHQGLLYDLQKGHDRKLITAPDELAVYLNQTILEGFRESGKSKLLLFVHGGLNSRNRGKEHFWKSYESILQGEYYPVFAVWPSGLTSSYGEHLVSVRRGVKAEEPLEKAFAYGTIPFVFLADAGRAATRLPLVIANTAKSDLETVRAATKISDGVPVTQYRELLAEGEFVRIGDDYSRRSDRFLRGVTYWLTSPIKYLLAAPLIDGFGKSAWDNMIRRTQYAYPAQLSESSGSRSRAARADSRDSAAQTRFSRRQTRMASRYSTAGLPTFIKALRQQPGIEVTLVGHSMGTIILNRVLSEGELDVKNVIYLAAACSVEDFSRSVIPYLRSHRDAQFFNLSLHPLAEVGEWNFADLAPRGSLLVWIDNFLANPVAERERTLGNWRNLFRDTATGEPVIYRFFSEDETPQLKRRLHFGAFSVGFGDANQMRLEKHQWNQTRNPVPLEDRCNTPLKHGEFSQMPYWLESFWWP